MTRVAGSDVSRHKVLAQHALAGAGLLDLGDDASVARLDLAAQRPDEIAHVGQVTVAGLGFGPHGGEGPDGQGCGDFLVFDGDDFLKDVRHEWALCEELSTLSGFACAVQGAAQKGFHGLARL